MSANEETPKTVPRESSDFDDNKVPEQQAQSSPTAADAQSRPTSRDSDKSSVQTRSKAQRPSTMSPFADISSPILQEVTFEDALETGSVRSLTKRQHSAVKRRSSEEPTIQEKEDEALKLSIAANGDPEEQQEKPAETADIAEKKPPRRLSQESAGELDNVNLDDDDTTTTSATAATTATAATSSTTTTTSSTAATAASTSTTATSSSTTPPESGKCSTLHW
mgnify:CR=1 FL=1